MTIPIGDNEITSDVTHLILVPIGEPPRPACGGIGRAISRADEVTCPSCLRQIADRRARIAEAAAVVHQTPVPDASVVSCGRVGNEAFLPADVTCPACQKLNGRPVMNDEPAVPEIKPGDEFIDVELDRWTAISCGEGVALRFGEGTDELIMSLEEAERTYGPLTKVAPATSAAEPAKSCPSCPHCGKTFHVEDAPAKTHDLSVFRNQGKLVIAVEDETDDCRVYLTEGVDKDLGRALALLTPAQIALLIGELTGGER